MLTLESRTKSPFRARLGDLVQRGLKVYADFRVTATHDETHNSSDKIVLSFDDYGDEGQVNAILQILAQHQIKAVFFVQGDWLVSHPELLQKIEAAGQLIGNHTFSHPDLLALNDADVIAQIRRGPQSHWLRPPRGRYDRRIRRLAAELGYSIKYWSIDSDDWQGTPAEAMHQKIMANIHPGAVILFHLHAAHTPQLLPGLIEAIRARGLAMTGPSDPIWDEHV